MSDTLLSQETGGAGSAGAPPAVTPPGTAPASTPPPTGAGLDYSQLIRQDGTIADPEKFFSGDSAHLAKRFTSVTALANSYASLEKMLSGKKVVIPSEDSPAEIREAFFKAAGRPDKPEDYGLQKPENIRPELWDENGAKEFATLAHQLGLSKTQAAKLAEWELTRGSKAAELMDQQFTQTREKAVGDLKKDWPGELFNQNLRVAKVAAIQFGGAEVVNDEALSNNPTFIRIMSKVGALIGDGGAAGARNTGAIGGMNPQEEINKILGDKTDPYWIANHPQHDSRVNHVAKLFAMKTA